jgi:glutamine synthetase adenylyltransferase
MPSTPEELTGDERRQLRRAHERLRTATQEVMALVATEQIKNRWEPEPAPPEILDAARSELQVAWDELARSYRELLGWETLI